MAVQTAPQRTYRLTAKESRFNKGKQHECNEYQENGDSRFDGCRFGWRNFSKRCGGRRTVRSGRMDAGKRQCGMREERSVAGAAISSGVFTFTSFYTFVTTATSSSSY